MFRRVSAREHSRQRLQIRSPVAQRRHVNMHDVQPVEQVVAKRTALDRVLQISVRQRNQPRID